ncbi:hypothetical protein KXX16_009390 [Aspergillus fumigatus]|nr:hypothetical protein CNMCM8689_001821 [Aspergillus fumigatus]KAH1396890.1 hypothetical protein KXX49_007224 [Aspergillus fumigatus]KAH1423503.1 hypothetical protein KXX64_008074 [Aspergillus fumigatus]KAH1584683.1 hypothetical protein KXX69_009441 [Aspergillus fumigatus]KAH1615434.1 hypothetical protein KXX31_002661 [Aspergillus fumigatus]
MFLNAQTFLLGSLGLALFTNSVTPAPTPANHPVRWRIHLYQNTRCSGVDTFYSGSGSLKCENEILNGGALGYISEMRQPPCEVVLYSDAKCKRSIGTVAADSPRRCQAPHVEGKTAEIRSFEVVC